MKNLECVKKKYGITIESIEELVTELKSIKKGLHPDTSGGEFSNEDKKNEYLMISDLIDSLLNRSTIEEVEKYSIAELNEILPQLMKQGQVIKDELQSLKKDFVEKIQSRKVDIKKNHNRIKITSTSVFSLMTTVFFLPNTFMENLFIGQIFSMNSFQFIVTWCYLLFVMVNIYIILRIIEDKQFAILEYYENDNNHSSIVDEFLSRFVDRDFSRRDFNLFLCDRININGKKNKYFILNLLVVLTCMLFLFLYIDFQTINIIDGRIVTIVMTIMIVFDIIYLYDFYKHYRPNNVATDNILDKFSTYIISKALSKGVITVASTNTVEDYYKISEGHYRS